MRELGASDKYFYYTASGTGATMDVRVLLKFKEAVNHQALLSAAQEALSLFPEYSVQPVLKGSRVFYEENHNPVAILPAGSYYDFGTSDMNGYLFCFQSDPAKEREVVFSVYHGLSDWNGLNRFLKTIVCRYAVKVKGLADDAFNGVIRSQAPESSEWQTQANLDPYEFYAKKAENPAPNPEALSNILEAEYEYDFAAPECKCYRITLSTSQYIKMTKSHNTSFVPYLLYLATKSLRKAYDTDKNIVMILPVDLRNVFKSDTIVNFSDSILVPATLEQSNAPLDEQFHRFRGLVNSQRNPEDYSHFLYDKVQKLKGFEAAPEGIVAKSRELTLQTPDIVKSISAAITYLGILDMPEGADDLLEDVIVLSPAGASVIVVTTYGDEMSIISMQRYNSDKLVKSICRELNTAGLETKLTDCGMINRNVMNLERLKRV